jgi:hypothetical protein
VLGLLETPSLGRHLKWTSARCGRLSLRDRDEKTPLVSFLVRFLQRQPYTQRGQPWDSSISAFLCYILNELGVTRGPDRAAALRVLCEHISDCRSSRNELCPLSPIMNKLSPGTRSVTNMPLSAHILPAAIVLGRTDTYASLFNLMDNPEHGMYSMDIRSEYFGTPLFAAVSAKQHSLVRHLVERFKIDPADEIHRSLEAAARNDDLAMVNLLSGLQSKYSTSQVITAVAQCAKLGHLDMARHLLVMAKITGTEIPPMLLGESWYYASMYGEIEFMELLVGYGLGSFLIDGNPPNLGTFWSSLGPMDVAAWRGDVEMVEWLLDHGMSAGCTRNEQDTGFSSESYQKSQTRTSAAAIGDSTDVLRIMFQAGAMQGRRLASDWARELSYSIIQQSNSVFRFLIEEAKVVRREDLDGSLDGAASGWYGHMMQLACSYGNVEAFEMLVRCGVPFDEPLATLNFGNTLAHSPGISLAWTPIMFAQASSTPGANTIVERLCLMGVGLVDMTQSSAKEYFESGYHPRRPSPERLIHRLTELERPRVGRGTLHQHRANQ